MPDRRVSPPFVSILLPVYNGAAYLTAALDSLRAQTHSRLEIIAIDDGSTDGSLAILEAAARDDHRIVVVTRENRGLVATLNEGLARASGRLVARMDADDISYPTRIARQVAAFADRPGLAMCGTGFDTIRLDRVRARQLDPIFKEGDLGILSLFFTLFIHPTVMFDRAVIGDGLAYDPRYLHAEDFDLFRRLTRDHPVHVIPESLLGYRLHEMSVTQRHKSVMRQSHMRIVSENLAREGFSFAIAPEALEVASERAVDRLAVQMLDLRDEFAARPAALRPSYEHGWQQLFYFFFGHLCDQPSPHLVARYLDATDGWGLCRRRDRAIYRACGRSKSVVAAGRSLSNAADAVIALAGPRDIRAA
ncbi:glycosyltransferase family 2 protein [Acuticoccus kandeliae]|uniref:glycosyltransferase family 2 protein n=1 Tax=Acuticoccus kandeliae TaxID=2073160 RepID=UPI00130073A3|nr:glycosyltransferase family A protein [Acuticoccus kandeliae]